MCILLCHRRQDNNGTISSAVEFPALAFDLKGGHMPYDLSATAHHKPIKGKNGHYTAISRSRNLKSQEWFMYDDERVSSVKFTKTHKKQTVVTRTHMKTATILFYVNPSIEKRIKNWKTIDLMEGGKKIDGDGEEGKSDGSNGDVPDGVKNSIDIEGDSKKGNAVQTDSEIIYVDGKEGKADGSSNKNDKMDDEEEEEKGESGKVDSSSEKESSGSSDSSSTTEIHRKRGTKPRGLRIIDSSSTTDSSDSSFSLGVSVLFTVVFINNMSSFYSRLGYKLLCK